MEKKPPRPRFALPRIYEIDRDIASGSYPNAVILAKRYEVGTATIHRDIEFMRVRMDAPIEYSALHRGFYYSDNTYRLPGGFATESDLMALGMVKTILTLCKNTPLFESATRLLEGIVAPLKTGKNTTWIDKRIVFPPVQEATVPVEIWNTVIDSLRENKILEFDYWGAKDSDYKRRRVYPYQLIFDNGRWCIFAWAEDRRDVRLFSLSRMRNIHKTGESFKLPLNFDFCSRTGGTFFGMYHGDIIRHYRIQFSGMAILIIKERKWADDQTITENKQGLILEFSSTQYSNILAWVLSFGQFAIPEEPKELVAEWRENVRKMGAM
ncbi:WYL domain-containing protein [Treponema sp. TIM-1]|uniref:helix-turn-helix transcriptional regulator n=1 Tax=Treponema sp. TIM-1 TaxID=2898417 RepID=UPI003980ADFD